MKQPARRFLVELVFLIRELRHGWLVFLLTELGILTVLGQNPLHTGQRKACGQKKYDATSIHYNRSGMLKYWWSIGRK